MITPAAPQYSDANGPMSSPISSKSSGCAGQISVSLNASVVSRAMLLAASIAADSFHGVVETGSCWPGDHNACGRDVIDSIYRTGVSLSLDYAILAVKPRTVSRMTPTRSVDSSSRVTSEKTAGKVYRTVRRYPRL